MKNTYGKHAIEFYLDYINNYLTVAKIAEHYNYSLKSAIGLIVRGKELYKQSLSSEVA